MAQFEQVPSLGDKHYEGDVTWEFDGTKWVKMSPIIKTENILLSDPTHPASLAASSMALPDVPAGTDTQLEANRYYMSALRAIDDSTQGIHVGENPPTEFSNGTLWYDSTAGVEKLKVYYDPTDTKTGTWVDGTPVDLTDLTDKIDDVETDLTTLTGRVSDNESDISDLQALTATHTGEISDIEDNIQEIQEKENTQQGQIDTLENKVEALEGTVIDAKYKLSNRPTPNAGEFQILDSPGVQSSFWQSATIIVFSLTDYLNNPHDLGAVKLNDFIRIGSAVGAAVYQIKSGRTTDGDGNYNFDVEIISQSELPGPGVIYDFEFTPGFDPSAYVTKTYVDDQDALKVNKTGDTITGMLTLSTEGQANDDGVRLYLKDSTGATNLTLFPSGLISSKNQIRVRRDSGDAFQVQTVAGATKAKWNTDGHIEAPRVRLTGAGSVNANERVIDIQSGVSGRLAYNGETRLSWGSSSIWVGKSGSLGDDVTTPSISLNLQNNKINNVGTLEINATDKSSAQRPFQIRGTLGDGTDDSVDFFYCYANSGAGNPDAMNYRGKMSSSYNLVNKAYVDDKFNAVSTDTLMPKAGGNFTGIVGFNRTDNNAQVNFKKTGSNDIQYKNSWIVSFQGDDNPKIKLNANLDANSNYIANVKNPDSDGDAVNRGYLKGARVTGTSSGTTKNGGFYQSDGRLFYKLQ